MNVSEGLIEWLGGKYPEALLVGALCFLVWFLTSRWERVYGRFRFTEEECNKIVKVHLPDIEDKFTTIDRKLNLLVISTQRISGFLTAKFKLDSNTFEANRPLRLTGLGNEILLRTGGREYIDKRLPTLINLIAKENPKSGLDVETQSNIVLIDKSFEDEFLPIKDFIFQNPVMRMNDQTVSIDLGIVIQIMAVYLRERYLEKYGGVVV